MSNAWATYPTDWDNTSKGVLILDILILLGWYEERVASGPFGVSCRVARFCGVNQATAVGWVCVLSASWWGNGLPRRRRVAGLRGWSVTLELRHGPDSYGRQQWGILGNGREPDPATPCGGRRPSGCKPLLRGKNGLVVNSH